MDIQNGTRLQVGKVTTLRLGINLNPMLNAWKLPSDIGNMTGLIHLYLYKCLVNTNGDSKTKVSDTIRFDPL